MSIKSILKRILKTIFVAAVLLCIIMFIAIYFVLKNDIVHEFNNFRIEYTNVYDNKDEEYILVKNSNNKIVLSHILDYYELNRNEFLIITTNGYYIFLDSKLVYCEKFEGKITRIFYMQHYDINRANEIINKYIEYSWTKTLNYKHISKEHVMYLKLLHRRSDGAIIDLTSHKLIAYDNNIKLYDNYLLVYNNILIRIVDLKQKIIYSLKNKNLSNDKENIMTYDEFKGMDNDKKILNVFKPTIYTDVVVETIYEIPISSTEIYNFYVESIKKTRFNRQLSD